MGNIIRYCFYCFVFISFCTAKSFGQITVSGPACVVSGIEYQYTITGHWNASSTMQVCVNNGYIQDSTINLSCTATGSPRNVVLVIWNDSASNSGTLSITSSLGNAQSSVAFMQPLLPGKIDSASKAQAINYNTIPAVIMCSQDSGAACSPIYNYQWQQSTDMISWADLLGAIDSSLTITDQLTQSTYYRRKVTEAVSGSIGYSDAASVFVVVMPTDSTADSTNINSSFILHKGKWVSEVMMALKECKKDLTELQKGWIRKSRRISVLLRNNNHYNNKA